MADATRLWREARQELTRLLPTLDALLDEQDDWTWRTRPAAGEWAPVEIVCHLRDEETDDFGARVRILVDGGQRFTRIDPERWAIERGYLDADPREAIEALRGHRAASLAWLASIAPEQLLAAIDRPGGGRLSALDLVAAWVAHDRLHLRQLAGALARLWATRWAPLDADYAGPIPYGPGEGG